MGLLAIFLGCLLLCEFASASTIRRNPTVFERLTKECVTDAYPPSESKVPWEVVDLDLPPDQRYNDLAAKKTDQLLKLLKYIKYFTSFILHGKLFDLVDKYLEPLADTLPAPYGDEIKGLSRATGIPLGEVVLYNIFYEIFTVCTSIVAEDKEGDLYHARNLDFGLFMGWDQKTNTWALSEILRTLVVNIDYRRNGVTVYKSVSFAGYVGVISGIKPGVMTLTVNERFSLDGGFIGSLLYSVVLFGSEKITQFFTKAGVIEWIFGKRDAKWSTFLTRDVLENATSFDQARNILANTAVLAPVYYILGGTKSGQGVVITRSRTKCLDQMSMNPSNNTWYVLETNYDNWKPPLVIDDRRTPAKACMNKMGQESVAFKGLYNVLSTQPVLNKLTTYTTLMHAATGDVETYIRNCTDPCFPW